MFQTHTFLASHTNTKSPTTTITAGRMQAEKYRSALPKAARMQAEKHRSALAKAPTQMLVARSLSAALSTQAVLHRANH